MTHLLSPHDAALVFAHFLPRFQLGGRGRYRGPAAYRGGNNPTALSVDVSQKVWYDHVTAKGGDVIDFVRVALGTDFVGAARAISDIIGRDLLNDRRQPRLPRFSVADLAEAELFVVGLRWHIERQLEQLKAEMWRALMKCDDAPDYSASVHKLTTFAHELRRWLPYQAAEALSGLRQRQPSLARNCVAEARGAATMLARGIHEAALCA